MKIYIACSLTHVPRSLFETYSNNIHRLAGALREFDGGSIVKYALVDSDPQLSDKPQAERPRLCYLWDRAMVEQADVVIAEASFPSIGLGIELQIAESRSIPAIICYSNYGDNRAEPVEYTNPDHSHHSLQIGSGYVSLMALGLPNRFATISYSDVADAISQLQQHLATLDRT